MCPVCLDYVNRRKADALDPTLDNWSAHAWPTLEDLEAARRRYPAPIFETEYALLATATTRDADAEIYEASAVWRMAPENTSALS